jgi:hypothetical protein
MCVEPSRITEITASEMTRRCSFGEGGRRDGGGGTEENRGEKFLPGNGIWGKTDWSGGTARRESKVTASRICQGHIVPASSSPVPPARERRVLVAGPGMCWGIWRQPCAAGTHVAWGVLRVAWGTLHCKLGAPYAYHGVRACVRGRVLVQQSTKEVACMRMRCLAMRAQA